MVRPNQLEPDRACVMVIDMQEKLMPMIRHASQAVAATRKILAGARIFRVPVLVTEQYPKGLGPTISALLEPVRDAAGTILEKPTFSACGDERVRAALQKLDRPQVILAGVETHVCVLQTALDLATMDYDVFVCADATGSRGALDEEMALARMRHEGVLVTTTESVLFELCHRCDSARFKEMIAIIKSSPPEPQ